MTRSVQKFINHCMICQSCKPGLGLLHPLPIPGEVWIDISMDFIERLPKFFGKEVTLVVVDRFSKAHTLQPCHIPMLHWMWPKCIWIMLSRYMAGLRVL